MTAILSAVTRPWPALLVQHIEAGGGFVAELASTSIVLAGVLAVEALHRVLGPIEPATVKTQR